MLVIQLLCSTLLSLSIFSSIAIAAPLPVLEPDIQHLVARAPGKSGKKSPRPVPTRAEVEKHLKVPAGESLFYSSDLSEQGTLNQAEAWAKEHHPDLKVINALWTNSRYPNTWQGEAHIAKQFWDVASEAMAAMSSGTVYVVLGPWKEANGKDWHSGSVWARKEWPALEANSAVTSVIRVNAATGATIKIK